MIVMVPQNRLVELSTGFKFAMCREILLMNEPLAWFETCLKTKSYLKILGPVKLKVD